MGLPHPQRELLVVSLKNLSPTSKRSSLCIFEFFTLSSPTLNERFSLRVGEGRVKNSNMQREVLFAYLNFSLSPPPLSTRGSLCLIDNELNEHSPPQSEVLFTYLNFSLSPPPPSTRGSLCLVDNELNEHSPPQREVLFAYLNFSLSPPPPSTRGSLCLVEKFVTPSKRSSLCLF